MSKIVFLEATEMTRKTLSENRVKVEKNMVKTY